MTSSSGEGGPEADGGDLFDVLYTALYRRARVEMARQDAGHTLQPTALVNEVYLRLGKPEAGGWNSKGHFMSVAARAMRQVLVDHARKKVAQKRSAEGERHPLEGLFVEYFDRAADIEALDAALTELGEFDPQMAAALELRFFAGREMKDVAEILGVPRRTLDRRWAATRAWLYRRVR